MEKINLNEYLASNEYPGRGIAVAMGPDVVGVVAPNALTRVPPAVKDNGVVAPSSLRSLLHWLMERIHA